MAVLGIDIGGSGIKGALVNIETGKFESDRFRLPTPEQATPEDVANTVKALVDHFQYKGPIGYGFPAVIRNGIAYTAANVDPSWVGTDAAALFSTKSGCPSFVLNDADAAGIAEVTFGAGRDEKGVIILLTLGTGIGTAIFTKGILVPNTEFGHLKIRGKDAERRASDGARQRKERSFAEWAVYLQEYLDEMEALFWPDLIIIGGGVSKEYDQFFPYLTPKAKLVPAMLMNQAGIIGAAMFAHNESQVPA